MTTELVDGKDVERLNNQELRAVLNALLTAEAGLHRVPLTDLDLTTRETDPDAGIDGRIKWPDRSHDLFSKGENVVQYKSGKITAEQIRTEFKKPGVRRALKTGGCYLLLVGHDYVRESVVKLREKTLRDLCRRQRIPAKRVRIIFGSAIARWISRHPPVVALPELRKNIIDFITVKKWREENHQLSNPFKADESRTATIEHIRSFLESTSGDSLLRVEGPAGVGKTRLALEAVSPEQYAVRTLYASSADNQEVQPFVSMIYSDREKSAIVVVDECDLTRQNHLGQYAENSNGRLKLICVGLSDVLHDSPPLSLTKIYQLKPLPDANIEAILRDSFPSAPKDLIDLSVRLSGGYVKLSIFIASVLDKYGPQVPLALKDVPDIRYFLHRFIRRDTLKSLQVLSLLARIGWEEELRDEAKSIAKFVGLPFSRLESAVAKLRKQGVVIPRGRYLYVSPDLLAIEAAADLWDEKGAELIEVVLKLAPAPRRQLLGRLAVMGEHHEVRKAVGRILNKKGLYPSLKELDEPFLAEVFRFLSSIVPVSAVDLLNDLVLPTSREELKGFRVGRREVLWAVESLLRWPETSLKAARVAMKLAISENEEIANNATSIFQMFFQVFLSSSPLPLMERFVLIDELIGSGDDVARHLAVKAISSALQVNESRFGGPVDPLSNKPYPPEWRPSTNDDVRSVRRKALTYLDHIGKGNDEAASLARRVRFDSVRALLQYGQAEDAVEVLKMAEAKTDDERRTIMESCEVINGVENLPDSLREQINQVRESLFGESYFGRLRRWVGKRINSDFDSQGASGFGAADKRAEELAEEGFRDGIGETEIIWLASPEAENVWIFGYRLGELDRSGRFFDQIARSTPNNINSLFLASYVKGRAATVGRETRETMLDRVAEEKPEAAFGATWRNDPTPAGVDRIIRVVSSGRVDASTLRVLMYGKWVEQLAPDYIIMMVDLMLSHGRDANLESVLGVIDQSVRGGAISISQLGDLIWQALETKAKSRSPNFDWRWGRVAELVASLDPGRLAHVFVSLFEADDSWLHTEDAQEVLQAATRNDPAKVWEVIGPALLKEDLTALRLRLKLDNWFGDVMPPELLIKWAQEHGRRAFLIAASLLNPKADSLSRSVRLLIRSAPNPEEIMSVLSANLRSGGSWGAISSRMEQDAATLEKWSKDEEPKIRVWAQTELARAKKEIQRQRMVEEEEQD